MQTYIKGHYCPTNSDLEIMNKTSIRKVLDTLKDAYPKALSEDDLHKRTGIHHSTIFANLTELYKNYYIEYENPKASIDTERPVDRGRTRGISAGRHPNKAIIEQVKPTYDIKGRYEKQKTNLVPPPGNVIFSDGFAEACKTVMDMKQLDEICRSIVHFVGYVHTRMKENENDKTREWVPEADSGRCCSQCELNHEGRDFLRALLLLLIDQVECHKTFADFLLEKTYITENAYIKAIKKISSS
jgi:hypothetical protein